MIEKDRRDVLHEAGALEAYLDAYFAQQGVTFDTWVARFSGGFYRTRNEIMLDFVRIHRPRRVFEFACAGPYLAQLLLEQVPGIQEYVCTNFSDRMVSFCARTLGGEPRFRAALADADVRRSPDMHRDRIAPHDLFLTTSLEHIEADRELIAQLPEGSAFVFSVALFDDPEHFRVFESPGDIERRYGDLLQIQDMREDSDSMKLVVSSNKAPGGA